MILKELNLISFGKFQQKRLDLEDGLNILYGENESGKTTIHNFIDGMFYGFLRPYVTKRYYLEEYEKYRPWAGEQYTGILRFIKNDRLYRIERDFGRGEVKVYDDLTGKDITKDIDTGQKVKVHLPGTYFFDFNTTVYKNTISIKQLGNRIDSSLSTEVKDRLANISSSLDDGISVKNAISDLEKQLENIGTERAYTRPYGRTIAELDRLKDKRKLALLKQEEYNKYIDEFHNLKEEIVDEEDRINQLQSKLEKAEIFDKKETYEEVLKINEELEIIDREIEGLKSYSKLSFDDYMEALKLESNAENLDREIRDLRQKIDNIEHKLKNIKLGTKDGIIKGIKVDELYEDMDSYNEMEDEKNQLILNSHKNKFEILNSELKNVVDNGKKSKAQGIIFILLAIGCLGLGLVNPFLAILALPFIGVSIYMRNLIKKSTQRINGLNEKIQELKSMEDEQNERLYHIEKCQRETMLKYSCSSRAELNRLYDDLRLRFMNQTDRLNEVNELNEEMKETVSALEVKENEKKKLREKVNTIIVKNNSRTTEEFKEGLEKKRTYDNLIRDRENKVEVLDKILGNIGLEELEAQLVDYDDEYFQYEDKIDTIKITHEIKDRGGILSNMKERYARLGERIDNLNAEVKKLIDIEEEINRLKNLIESFENRIESIEIAKDTIETIAQEIHDQFAPTINKEVSKMISLVTHGKYDRVRINDELNIAVENPLTKEIIDIDSLSGGTIDQLYFALRFSIISSIKGDNLPLILDDCFIQYDDERLKNILELLNKISDEKQILLFTCHNREREILDNLGLKYNLINLS